LQVVSCRLAKNNYAKSVQELADIAEPPHGFVVPTNNLQQLPYRFGENPKIKENVTLRLESTVTLSAPLIGVGPVVLNGSV